MRASGTVYAGTGESGAINLSAIGRGAPGNHLVVQKYPGDSASTVYVRGLRGGGGGPGNPINVTFRNFTINGGNFTPPSPGQQIGVGSCIMEVSGARFENLIVENCWLMGIQFVGQSQFINMTVRFNGFGQRGNPSTVGVISPGGYGVYTGSAGSFVGWYDGNLFDGGRYHDNAGFGIHCYIDCGDTIIRNLRIDHNGSPGVIMAFKAGSQIYNVVADNNGSSGGQGIWLAGNGLVGDNLTAYNNGGADIMVSSNSNIIVRDSIALNGISDRDGLGYTGSNNITSGSASTYFVDAANGNFQLTPTATAQGVGANLSSLN